MQHPEPNFWEPIRDKGKTASLAITAYSCSRRCRYMRCPLKSAKVRTNSESRDDVGVIQI